MNLWLLSWIIVEVVSWGDERAVTPSQAFQKIVETTFFSQKKVWKEKELDHIEPNNYCYVGDISILHEYFWCWLALRKPEGLLVNLHRGVHVYMFYNDILYRILEKKIIF